MQKTSQQSQKQPNRRSIRVRKYDYSGDGSYFITICTEGRRSLFGTIIDGEMNLNKCGIIVSETWQWLGRRYHIFLDEYVVMPNHFHGVIAINNARSILGDDPGASRGAPTKYKHKPLGELVGALKTVSTKRINEIRNRQGVKLWQRNYYEHIIRDEYDHYYVCEYIQNNPINWAQDCNYVNL
jgi:putative transposase